MNAKFRAAMGRAPELMKGLNMARLEEMTKLSRFKKKAGVYLLFEDKNVVHVGRTRNLERRLRGHTANNHHSASFAFKRARRALGARTTYTTKGSRAALMKDPAFAAEFQNQLTRIRKMCFRFLEVSDSVSQYLLELYAHLEFALPLDEFDTH